AEAANLAVQARSALSDPLRAAFWAAQAVERQSSAETRSILLESVLALTPHLAKARRTGDPQPAAIAWSPDSSALGIGSVTGRLMWLRPFVGSASAAFAVVQIPSASSARPAAVLALAWTGASLIAVMRDGRVVIHDSTGGGRSVGQIPGSRQITQATIGTVGRLLVADFSGDIGVFRCAATGNNVD